jgi:adenine-specific DNA-methyltransferase
MDREQLREKLTQAYDRTSWLELVRDVFPHVSINNPPGVVEVEDKQVRAFHQLGSVTLQDDKHLALFEVELHDGVNIARNRVAVRKLITQLIDEAAIHGALGVFTPEGDDYRFTFAARESTFTPEGEFVQTETAPKRYTYVLGPNETCATAAQRLTELKAVGAEMALADVREAFSLEKLNKEFYGSILRSYTRLVGGTLEKREVEGVLRLPAGNTDESKRKYFAVRLLARTIFCWFLKHKYQDDADRPLIPKFLLSSEAVAQHPDYYHQVLEKLFFQMLNRPMNERIQHLPAGAHLVPFLNGGLFEPRPKEDFYEVGELGVSRHVGDLKIPDEWFCEFFQALEQYNFTIDENTPSDAAVSIDPEILGRIFENLLAEINPETGQSARKAKGSFYTPRNIVDYMVEESLVAHLLERVDGVTEAQLRPLFDEDAEECELPAAACHSIVRALGAMKVLDPACGSGAFPVGALQKMLVVLRKVDPANDMWVDAAFERIQSEKMTDAEQEHWLADLEQALAGNEADYGRKLIIVQNCIYGVDIDPIAVEIARLRFFLTLMVEETMDDTAPNRGILPLPNLDFKLVCANTLVHVPKVDELRVGNELGLVFEDPFVDAFAAPSRDYFYARNPAEKGALRKRIRELVEGRAAEVSGLIGEAILNANKEIQKRMEELSAARAGDLAELAEMWRSYANLFTGDPVAFFEPEYMFPDVPEGFDLVIGNPPYVRHEQIKPLKPLLKAQYEDYCGTADLYVFFYLRGLELLREGGHLCFISSNKYFRSSYGASLRKRLAGDTCIRQLVDFGDAPVFDAIAYPSIALLQAGRGAIEGDSIRALNWKPGPSIKEFADVMASGSFALCQSQLGESGWQLEPPEVLALLRKLQGTGRTLSEYVNGKFYYGIKTGCNEAFVVDRATRDRLIAEHPSSGKLLKPFLRGKDVKRWRTRPQDLWLIFVPWHCPLEDEPGHSGVVPGAEKAFANQFPAIYKHLCKYKGKLASRNQAETGIRYEWYCLQRCAATYADGFTATKIVYPDIYEHQSFALDTGGHFLANTCYFIPDGSPWLCGVLNSRCLEWFYRRSSSSVRGGYLRSFSTTMGKMPICEAGDKDRWILGDLVDRACKCEAGSSELHRVERELDEHVYRLYGLTQEEVSIIETGE